MTLASLVGKSKGLKGKFGPCMHKHGTNSANRDKKPKWFIDRNVSGISARITALSFDQIKKK